MAKNPFTAIDKVDDIQVYPMTLGDSERVSELFAKFNPDVIGLAMIQKDSRDAMIEVLKIATKLEDDKLSEINVNQAQEIIDMYIGISKLKKKMME